jgi:hypothetical protein
LGFLGFDLRPPFFFTSLWEILLISMPSILSQGDNSQTYVSGWVYISEMLDKAKQKNTFELCAPVCSSVHSTFCPNSIHFPLFPVSFLCPPLLSLTWTTAMASERLLCLHSDVFCTQHYLSTQVTLCR